MFIKQWKLTRTANDLLIGIFFVLGSLLNFFEFTSIYGNVLYFLGSFILACRAVYNIKESKSFVQEPTKEGISHFHY